MVNIMTNNQKFFAASTVTVNAEIQDIWSVLEDVRGWINWDQRLEDIEYTGPFQSGVSFTLVSAERTPNKAKFKMVTKDVCFSYETDLSFCVILNNHQIEKIGRRVKITCEIEATIEDAAIEAFSKKIWPKMQIGLAVSLNNLVSLVES